VLPDQSAGLALIATPLLTTTSVMLVSIGLAGMGYRLQQTPELTPLFPRVTPVAMPGPVISMLRIFIESQYLASYTGSGFT
jgi:hypothetical protein